MKKFGVKNDDASSLKVRKVTDPAAIKEGPRGVHVHVRFHDMNLAFWLRKREAHHLALKTGVAKYLKVSTDDMGPVTEVEGSVIATFFLSSDRYLEDIFIDIQGAGNIFDGTELEGHHFDTIVKHEADNHPDEIKKWKDETDEKRGVGCKVYQDDDFGGWCAFFPEGDYTLGEAQKRGFKNDDMSSIIVEEGYEVELFQHGDFGGM